MSFLHSVPFWFTLLGMAGVLLGVGSQFYCVRALENVLKPAKNFCEWPAGRSVVSFSFYRPGRYELALERPHSWNPYFRAPPIAYELRLAADGAVRELHPNTNWLLARTTGPNRKGELATTLICVVFELIAAGEYGLVTPAGATAHFTTGDRLLVRPATGPQRWRLGLVGLAGLAVMAAGLFVAIQNLRQII